MEEHQTSIIDHLSSPLIALHLLPQHIIYLNHTHLCQLTHQSVKQQQVAIKGQQVKQFAGGSTHVVLLLHKKIQIRSIEQLNEVQMVIEGVTVMGSGVFPIMKLNRNELYLVYPTLIQIINIKDGTKSRYADLVSDPSFHRIHNLAVLDLSDSLNIAAIQLKNKIMMAIIPCTITELHIEAVSQVICLHPHQQCIDPQTAYLAVLSEGFKIKVYDFVDLRQISQIEIPSYEAIVEVETDPKKQFLVVQYTGKMTGECISNVVFKINTAMYYNRERDEDSAFMLYRFEIKMRIYLSPAMFQDKLDHSYFFYFYKDQHLCSLKYSMEKNFKMSEQQMQSITDKSFWPHNQQWKEIINTYMQIQEDSLQGWERQTLKYEEEEQLEQYYKITKDFDQIVNCFSQIISQKSRHKTLNQKQVECEWQNYILEVARQRNFKPETMNLFKIDYQTVKGSSKEKKFIGIQLQNCMTDIEDREKRIDTKIRQKRQQLKEENIKREQLKEEQESIKPETLLNNQRSRPQLTQEEIQKEQDQYNSFVSEYLAQINKKQQEEEIINRQKKKNVFGQGIDPQFKLELPQLSEEERRLIQHKSLDVSRVSIASSQEHQELVDPAWKHLQSILTQVQKQISPLEEKLQGLITKLDKIEAVSLEKIKENQDRLQQQMGVDLEIEVKGFCRNIFSKMGVEIRGRMDEAMSKLHQIEQQIMVQTEESIEQFKIFARMQVRHRVERYHRSRKNLERCALKIAKESTLAYNHSDEFKVL